ncbi:major capsid protein [Serratia proteamaculans]
MAKKEFDNVDLVGSYKSIPVQPAFLQSIGAFDEKPVKTVKIDVDFLKAESAKLFQTTTRYGSDLNTIKTSKGQSFSVELPHEYAHAEISSSDFQGRRAIGSEDEVTVEGLMVQKMADLKDSHVRTKELALWNALAHGTVIDDKTNGGDVNWATTFGATQETGTVSSAVTGDPLKDLSLIVSKLRRNMGGWVRNSKGIVVLAGDDLFNAIRFHPLVAAAAKQGLIDGSFIYGAGEVNPGFNMFSPFANLTIVQNDNPDFELDADSGLAFPLFRKTMGTVQSPLTSYYGPASRDLQMARSGAARESFVWSTEDEMHNIKIHHESSQIAVNYDMSFTSAIKLAPAN